MTKLDIKALKEYEDILVMLNKKNFKALKHSSITIDEKGVSTNAGTKDDDGIQYRDSLVIGALAFNLLLLIADKWDSIDNECREFIENNLEMITNFMKGKVKNEKN